MHRCSILRAGMLLALGSTAVLGACGDGQPLESTRTGAATTRAGSGADVARLLAAGLGDAAARQAVHGALAASPLNEHKLVLQEFARTPAGQRLVAASAARGGVSEAALLAWIDGLPRADFYVPVRAHRLSWQAGEPVLVGYTADEDSPRLTAYSAAGARVQLHARDGVPAQPLLIIHTAEPKWTRRDAGLAAPRGTIERADAGPSLTGIINPDACDPAYQDCSVEGSPGPYTGPPMLTRFITYPGDGWGDSEVRFRHFNRNSQGQETTVWTWTAGNVQEDEWARVNQYTTLASMVDVLELDSGGTLDDDVWGEAYIGASGQETLVYAECIAIYADGPEGYGCGAPDPRLTTRIVYLY